MPSRPFDYQPVLRGELVTLRLLVAEDYDALDSVVLLIGPKNVRSQRAAEKIGAVRDGSRPDAEGRPSYVYRITRPD